MDYYVLKRDWIIKSIIYNLIIFVTGFIVLSFLSLRCGLGFFIGGISASTSFYLLRNSVGAEIERKEAGRSMARSLLSLGGRSVIVTALLLIGFAAHAHPVGILSGITLSLIVEVFLLIQSSRYASAGIITGDHHGSI